ncbi:hypothetical protein HDV63DRAFT_152524 [Trichoderma sp. SZMC 28014]
MPMTPSTLASTMPTDGERARKKRFLRLPDPQLLRGRRRWFRAMLNPSKAGSASQPSITTAPRLNCSRVRRRKQQHQRPNRRDSEQPGLRSTACRCFGLEC